MKLGEEVIALGIVYLIKPSLVREYGCENLQKVKTAASKVYNLYIANKAGRNWNINAWFFIFMVLTTEIHSFF